VLLAAPPPPIPVNRPEAQPWLRLVADDLRWLPLDGNWHLFRGGRQIGTFLGASGEYLPFDADRRTFGQPCELPAPLPDGAGKVERRAENYGLESGKIPQSPTYRLNGRDVPAEAAIRALAGGDLTDDSGKLRLTVVGDPALRKQVLGDLANAPALAGWRERLLVQDYEPGHWAVAGVGLAPGVTVQAAPDDAGRGRVLVRLREYQGADQLADALRRADPGYRPERDPGPAWPGLPAVPREALIGVAAALVILILAGGRNPEKGG
jgi:hypothetical protein